VSSLKSPPMFLRIPFWRILCPTLRTEILTTNVERVRACVPSSAQACVCSSLVCVCVSIWEGGMLCRATAHLQKLDCTPVIDDGEGQKWASITGPTDGRVRANAESGHPPLFTSHRNHIEWRHVPFHGHGEDGQHTSLHLDLHRRTSSTATRHTGVNTHINDFPCRPVSDNRKD
jgi:hypothetical protein